MNKIIISFLCLFNVVHVQAKTYSLTGLISIIKDHPELSLEDLEIKKANSLFEKIDGETRPKLSLLAGVGPNKSAHGNSLSSSQSTSIDTVTFLSKIDLKIPLFAFNRQNDLYEAASGNKQTKEVDKNKKEAQLIKQLKEFYYSLQYTTSLNDFATSTIKDLDEVIQNLKNNKKENTDDYSKLTIFRSLAYIKKIEVEKAMSQASLGLKYISQDENPTIEQDYLEYIPKKIPELSYLKQTLMSSHFDLLKLEAGFKAKNALLTSEKKSQLPIFGLFSSFDWKNTQKSEKQNSVFSNDPFNKSDFSIGLGMIWDIDFGIKSSNIHIAQYEVEALQIQKVFALKNIPLKIEKIYLDVSESQQKAEELEKTYKSTKKVFNKAATGVALGLSPAKEIIESYTKKAEIYQQYLEAIYQFELRLAELSFEFGKELDPLLQK